MKFKLKLPANGLLGIMSNTNKDYFKNAGGDCETFISKIKLVHSKRVFTLDKSLKFKINIHDIKEALEMIKKYKLDIVEDKKFLDYYILYIIV